MITGESHSYCFVDPNATVPLKAFEILLADAVSRLRLLSLGHCVPVRSRVSRGEPYDTT